MRRKVFILSATIAFALASAAQAQDISAVVCNSEGVPPFVIAFVEQTNSENNGLSVIIDGRVYSPNIMDNGAISISDNESSTFLIFEKDYSSISVKGLLNRQLINAGCTDFSGQFNSTLELIKPMLE